MKKSSSERPGAGERVIDGGEARIRKSFIAAVAVFGPIMVLVLYYKMRFPGLTNPDALDFAQIGRNIASGRGFNTYFLRPLALTHGNSAIHQPDVTHGPLYPFLLAIAFSALGAKDSVVAGVSSLFYLLTIPAVYLLGKRVFSVKVGTVAATVFALSAVSLDYATSGLHLTLAILLTTCLLLSVYQVAAYTRSAGAKTTAPSPIGKLVTVGALAALLYLTDPLYFWVLPVIGLAVITILPSHRGTAALWFVLPIVVVAGPWMLRNMLITGNPVFGLRGAELMMNTRNYFPGMSAYRMLPSEVVASPGLLQAVIKKAATGIGTVLDSWPSVGGNWVLVFFLPSLFFRFSDTAANSLRRTVLLSMISLTIGMLFFEVQMPILMIFVPGMLIFAIAYLMFLIQQAQLDKGATIRLVTLLSAALIYPLLSTLTLAPKISANHEEEAARALTERSRPDDLVLSDQPWSVAWYSNRPAIIVPYTETNVADIRQRFSTLHWLFLTQSVGSSSSAWRGLYQGLLVWNNAYAGALEHGQTPPSSIRIDQKAPPLMAALNGFETYPPLEKGTPSTLVAFAPPMQTGMSDLQNAGTSNR